MLRNILCFPEVALINDPPHDKHPARLDCVSECSNECCTMRDSNIWNNLRHRTGFMVNSGVSQHNSIDNINLLTEFSAIVASRVDNKFQKVLFEIQRFPENLRMDLNGKAVRAGKCDRLISNHSRNWCSKLFISTDNELESFSTCQHSHGNWPTHRFLEHCWARWVVWRLGRQQQAHPRQQVVVWDLNHSYLFCTSSRINSQRQLINMRGSSTNRKF